MKTVVKRDGNETEYRPEKIKNAILKAATEVGAKDPETISVRMMKTVDNLLEEHFYKDGAVPGVEDIQDLVEKGLVYDNNYEVSKAYILYREKRNERRKTKDKTNGPLSYDFLSDFKHMVNPFPTELGQFVYYRTYSRWLEDEERRENWWETVKRAVEYNTSLLPTNKKETEKLYENVFSFKNFLAGRTLWAGGGEVSRKYSMSNFNCSFRVLDSVEAYGDIFYLLMLGSGAGFRVLPEDVKKLPKFRTDIKIINKSYEPRMKEYRSEHTELNFNKNIATIHVGDSKEGWIQSLLRYFDLLSNSIYRDIDTVVFEYDSVRPKGEKLKTFGGTASGYESLERMFKKIDWILSNVSGDKIDDKNRYELRPIDAMDFANIIAENVVSGGVRRSSQICLFSADDKDIIEAKSNLYKQVDGDWVLNEEISHRQMSNNTIYYEDKPSKEQLAWHVKQMRFSGEPGFLNVEEAKRRREDFNGVNPCFTGDMRLLTKEGYKTFEELNGRDVDVVNINGKITKGKVWSNGVKDIVEIKLSDGRNIKCTPDHVFMDSEGNQIEANNMKHRRIMPAFYKGVEDDTLYSVLGFIQGDGSLTRLKSETHKGIEINLGEKDDDVLNLLEGGQKQKRERVYYTGNYNDKLIELGFSSDKLPERSLPETFSDWSMNEKKNFIKGLYSANGSVIGDTGRGRVTLKSTCKKLIDQVGDFLDSIGIKNYTTTNESKKNKFANGVYSMKESYDLNIGTHHGKMMFFRNIGFIQKYKELKLKRYLKLNAPKVVGIKSSGQEEVYDFNEPETHWGVVEDVVVHNCAEILLDSNGVCNLTTTNCMMFVKDGELDRDGILEAQRLAARAGYRMANVEFELHDWDIINKRDRLVGVSLTGWQDMVNALGWDDSFGDALKNKDELITSYLTGGETGEGYIPEGILKQIKLLNDMREAATEGAKSLAEEVGGVEPKLVTTVKPEGTQSQMPTVSSGLHYSHSPYFIRRVRISATDPLVDVCDELGYEIKPENGHDPDNPETVVLEFPVKAPKGITKSDVSAIEQLEMYRMFMKTYVDHNASITVHVRDDEWDDVERWLWYNWDDVVGVSFISYNDNFYELMPYEEIDEEEYLEMEKNMKPFRTSLISKYEIEHKERLIDDSSCESGACPVR